MKEIIEQVASLTIERNEIRNENEKIENRCQEMEQIFKDFFDSNEKCNLDSFHQDLEKISQEKEKILKEDQLIEAENKDLWEEAKSIRIEMETIAQISHQVDEDGKEMNDIFLKINDERGKLIEQDKLLNNRYSSILENIQRICQERIELRHKMEASSDETEKDHYLTEDLSLAGIQKDAEDAFDQWKKEKELVLKDNNDLDDILDNLLVKFEYVKQKKAELQNKSKDLESESESLKTKFALNQDRKENIIKLYKKEDRKVESILEEINSQHENSEDTTDNKSNIKNAVMEFEGIKLQKEKLMSQDENISLKLQRINSEYEHLAKEKQNQHKEIESKKAVEVKIMNLITRKEEILKQDEEIALKFEKFEKEIDCLQKSKQNLKKQIEDINWEACLQGNDLDQ